MTSNVKSYFESHAHNYPKNKEFYISIVDQIKRVIPLDRRIKLFDVGCGDGNFIKSLSNAGVDYEYYATDLSFNMVNTANKNLHGRNVGLFVANAFNIPVKEDFKFDIIHIDSVLHHLIARTRSNSNRLAKRIIDELVNRLAENGILILQEINFRSYCFPPLTSTLVFYALKVINFLKLDLTRLIPDVRPGLEVNFLDEAFLLDVLREYGSVRKIHFDSYHVPRLYRIFLLKQYGHSTYLISN
jgi:SAM-dependent methyltransferase